MAKASKTMLPKDFESMLAHGDVAQLCAVFDTCHVDARGGSSKQTALAFAECPEALARWLVDRGADVNAVDKGGLTPLHSHARAWNGRPALLLALGADVHAGEGAGGTPLHMAARSCKPGHAHLLIDHGARIDALDAGGITPLESALRQASNAQLVPLADLAALLLGAGATVREGMAAQVTRLGKTFEFHRERFNPESRDAASAALDRLYTLFGVLPVPRRVLHDGASPIVVPAGRWQDTHPYLWDLLVPSTGAAATMQGEAIRISGRIALEIDGNGGTNWDSDFHQMADALLATLGSGHALAEDLLQQAADAVAAIKARHGDPRVLCELAVAWVARNSTPLPLARPAYRR